MKKEWTIAFVWFLVGVLFCIVGSMFVVGTKDSIDNSEVGTHEYKMTGFYIREFPSLKPSVHESMKDGKMTNSEYATIKDVYSKLEFSLAKEELIKKSSIDN